MLLMDHLNTVGAILGVESQMGACVTKILLDAYRTVSYYLT